MAKPRALYRSFAAFIIAAASMVGCETTAVQSVHDRYLQTWNEQLQQYYEQYKEWEAVIKENDVRIGQQVASAPEKERWAVLINGVFDLGGQIEKAFEIAGRGEALKAFLAHVQSGPAPGMTDGWFVRQIDELKQRAQSVDQESQTFIANFEQKVRQGVHWIAEVEAIYRARGYVSGYHKELQSLYQQAAGHFGDLQRAGYADHQRAQKQAQAAQALMLFGMYLNQMQYQQQLLNTLNRPRTCTSTGNSITCY